MKRTNKKIINEILLGMSLSILLGGGCLLAPPPLQADQDRIPILPQGQAALDQAGQLAHEAALDLHLGNYMRAEEEARQAEALNLFIVAPEILAGALEGQGKDQAALEAYRELAAGSQPRNLLPYAQLLLKSGQWEQAVTVYNQVLPRLGNGEIEKETGHFSPDMPQPVALEIAIHLERGQIYNGTPSWAGEPQDTEAMAEYAKALQLAPDNAFTNYFYGVGWQKLSPADRARFGTVQQTKAHLQKAVKVGKGNVKADAEKALKAIG